MRFYLTGMMPVPKDECSGSSAKYDILSEIIRNGADIRKKWQSYPPV